MFIDIVNGCVKYFDLPFVVIEIFVENEDYFFLKYLSDFLYSLSSKNFFTISNK